MSSKPPSRFAKRRLVISIALLVTLVSGGLFWVATAAFRKPNRVELSVAALLAKAQSESERRDFEAAIKTSGTVLAVDRFSVAARLIGARASLELGRTIDAIGWLQDLPSDPSPELLNARCTLTNLLASVNRLGEAEDTARAVTQQAPGYVVAHDRLGQLLALQGRTWEALPHLQVAIRQEEYQWEQLIAAVAPETVLNKSVQAQVTAWLAAAPDDARAYLAMGILKQGDEQYGEAIRLLRVARKLRPDLSEVDARLGRLLLKHQSEEDLVAWFQSLAPLAKKHPLVWLTLGEWALRKGDSKGALRCFLETVTLDPSSRAGCYQAGQVAIQLGDKPLGQPLSVRAKLLDERQVAIEVLLEDRRRSNQLADAGRICEQLGQKLVAQGFYAFGYQLDASDKQWVAALQRLRPQILANANDAPAIPPAIWVRERWPLPDFGSRNLPANVTGTSPSVNAAAMHFENVAAATGLAFQYDNDQTPGMTEMRAHETSGGGIAICDFDGDGWPDTYFSQGCKWPAQTSAGRPNDQLFQNRNGRFVNVTERAGVLETGYGQGVTAGDTNNDGFPEIYVANAGTNTLFHNNGDGTFANVTNPSGTAGDEWTSSCAFVDLNNDGNPEVVTSGYCAGDDVFTRYCVDEQGIRRSCKPRVYNAAPDRCYWNLGDGSFCENRVPMTPGSTVGRGFGIVAAKFDLSDRVQIFVANDSEANFFLSPPDVSPHLNASRLEESTFVDDALASGLAFNRDGLPQACMGVASGDINNDGLLDLLVTNYYHEGSTLYRQVQPQLFVDQSRESGLYDLSFPHLGFGTQFVDFDLNGTLDLFVANGHEGDYTDLGVPHKMPPQVLRLDANLQFHEEAAETLGPYFQGKLLGRAVAVCDFNRDGRPDITVGHLDKPYALLENTTDRAGHFLKILLQGTASARDAVGTRVTARLKGKTLYRQLTAGDGYQASNEKTILIGIDAEDIVSELEIIWPSGLKQVFHDVAADQELIIVEGRPQPVQVSN